MPSRDVVRVAVSVWTSTEESISTRKAGIVSSKSVPSKASSIITESGAIPVTDWMVVPSGAFTSVKSPEVSAAKDLNHSSVRSMVRVRLSRLYSLRVESESRKADGFSR